MFDSHTEFSRTPWVKFGVTGGEQWYLEVGENYWGQINQLFQIDSVQGSSYPCDWLEQQDPH